MKLAIGRIRIPGIWIAVIVLYVISGIIAPKMFSPRHLFNLLQIGSFLGIVALGQTLVILTGGIDLSVSSVVMGTNILVCMLMNGGKNSTVLAVLICLFLGIVVGAVNGLLISKVKIIPLICTLAMNSVIFGLALLYTGGFPKGSVSKEFSVLGQGKLFGVIPVSFLVWMLVTAILVFITKKTSIGRKIYALGANKRAAHAAGINTDVVTITAYIMCSLTAVITGLIISAYINLPSFGVGEPYALNSIAAVVVGGTLLSGGIGSVMLTAAGALFITQLNSLTNMLNISTGGQFLVQGIIIIVGVVFSSQFGRNRINLRGRKGGEVKEDTTKGTS